MVKSEQRRDSGMKRDMLIFRLFPIHFGLHYFASSIPTLHKRNEASFSREADIPSVSSRRCRRRIYKTEGHNRKVQQVCGGEMQQTRAKQWFGTWL